MMTEQFQLALDAAPSGMLMVDSAGRIVLVNARIEALFGYPRAELIGQPVEMLVPARSRAAHPGLRARYGEAPRARAMGGAGQLFGLRKDGSELPVEIGLNPMRTPDGDFVLSSIADISERLRANEQFRLAIEAAPTGMLMVDADGRIVLVNAQIEALFGYTRAELIGQSVDMLVPAPLRAGHPGLRAGFLTAPQARPMGAGRELHGLRKDGVEVPIEIGLNPLRTGAGDFVLGSVVDITERLRAQRERDDLAERRVAMAELSATLKERDTLLQEIHHRVKNNLQVVSSLISIQMNRTDDGASRAALGE